MNAAKCFAVESTIPAAAPDEVTKYGQAMTRKQKREDEDVTAWLELQEDAEIDALTKEMASKADRRFDMDCPNAW